MTFLYIILAVLLIILFFTTKEFLKAKENLFQSQIDAQVVSMYNCEEWDIKLCISSQIRLEDLEDAGAKKEYVKTARRNLINRINKIKEEEGKK